MNWLKKLVALVAMLAVVWAALSPSSTPHVWALLVPVLVLAAFSLLSRSAYKMQIPSSPRPVS